MAKVRLVLIALALLAAACSPSEAAPDSAPSSSSTTTIAPVTTLAPPSTTSSTTTTVPPTTTTTTLPPNECEVAPVEDDFYSQGCTTLGLMILSGEQVDPAAVTGLSDRAYNMLVLRPDYSAALAEHPIGLRVIGEDQRITDLPEFVDLYREYPGTDWRRAGRSFPGTELVPFAAGAEENLMCSNDDRYEGEDWFIKDFAITIRRFAMGEIDPSTSDAIEQAYGTAIAEGKWVNTLAEINSDQYWSEGVQSFFDVNLEDNDEDREPNSAHNHVNTRDELREYDRALWAIATSLFGDTDWRPTCAD